MRRLIVIFSGAILLVGMGMTLLAQPEPGPPHARRMVNQRLSLVRALRDQNLRAKLGVTDEQYAKLRTAFLNSSTTAIKNKADLKIKRLELASLMDADKVDHAQVDQKINEISALQGARLKNQIQTRLTVKETLTADQLNKLHEWGRAQMRRFGEERMERGMGMMRRSGRPEVGPQGPQAPRPPAPPKPDNPSDPL
ncbi:MAG: periplasmic heavy metal sensor [Acidobacteriia bacterium]|nr:periplasmic heavy metal sensor [Terriglobia bacterium]